MNTCKRQAHLVCVTDLKFLSSVLVQSVDARTQRLAYPFAHVAPCMDSECDIARGALDAMRCEILGSKHSRSVRSMIDLKAKRHMPACFESCGLLADRADENKSEGWRS